MIFSLTWHSQQVFNLFYVVPGFDGERVERLTRGDGRLPPGQRDVVHLHAAKLLG